MAEQTHPEPYVYNAGITTVSCSALCPGQKARTTAAVPPWSVQVGADPLVSGREL